MTLLPPWTYISTGWNFQCNWFSRNPVFKAGTPTKTLNWTNLNSMHKAPTKQLKHHFYRERERESSKSSILHTIIRCPYLWQCWQCSDKREPTKPIWIYVCISPLPPWNYVPAFFFLSVSISWIAWRINGHCISRITTAFQKPMDSRAERRLQTVRNHLISTTACDQPPVLRPQHTAGEFFSGNFSFSLWLISFSYFLSFPFLKWSWFY